MWKSVNPHGNDSDSDEDLVDPQLDGPTERKRKCAASCFIHFFRHHKFLIFINFTKDN